MLRKIVLSVLAAFIGGSALGMSAAWQDQTSVLYAACGTLTNCGGDATVTSALEVNHIEGPGAGGDPVEPDAGETWEIEAVWAHAADFSICACSEWSSSVTAAVTWTGSAWSVSCTGCNPSSGPIRSVSICSGDSCGSNAHAWSYTLIVDINEAHANFCTAHHLQRVEYTTTSIDDGDVIDTSRCDEDAAVSPITQTVNAIDYGAFECALNCNAAAATTDIEYQ